MPSKVLLRDDEKLEAFTKNLIKNKAERLISKNRLNLSSLYLIGSLSRGEGSAYFDEKKPVLLSDVDFLAITRFPLKIFSESDVAQVPFYKLGSLKNNYELFDWRLSGIKIYGKEYLNKLPKKGITKQDIKNIVRSRYHMTKNMVSGLKTEYMRLSDTRKMIKFLFSLADWRLFKAAFYSPSPVEKTAKLKKIANDEPLTKFCEEGLEFLKHPETPLEFDKIKNFTLRQYFEFSKEFDDLSLPNLIEI